MHGQGREFYSCQARPQAKGRDMSMHGHGRVVLLMLGARSGQGYGIILQRFQSFIIQQSIKLVGDICMHGQGREFYSCQARPQAKGQGYEHAWPREGSFTYVGREVRPKVRDYSIEILVFYYSVFYQGGWGHLHAWKGKGVLFMLGTTSGQGQGYEHAWPQEGSFTYVRCEVRPRVWDYSIEILVLLFNIL